MPYKNQSNKMNQDEAKSALILAQQELIAQLRNDAKSHFANQQYLCTKKCRKPGIGPFGFFVCKACTKFMCRDCKHIRRCTECYENFCSHCSPTNTTKIPCINSRWCQPGLLCNKCVAKLVDKKILVDGKTRCDRCIRSNVY